MIHISKIFDIQAWNFLNWDSSSFLHFHYEFGVKVIIACYFTANMNARDNSHGNSLQS